MKLMIPAPSLPPLNVALIACCVWTLAIMAAGLYGGAPPLAMAANGVVLGANVTLLILQRMGAKVRAAHEQRAKEMMENLKDDPEFQDWIESVRAEAEQPPTRH
jgi:hypothetical protein